MNGPTKPVHPFYFLERHIQGFQEGKVMQERRIHMIRQVEHEKEGNNNKVKQDYFTDKDRKKKEAKNHTVGGF